MRKHFFLIFILALVFLLTGWIYYINSRSSNIEPVEKISAKWWGSAHADVESEAFTHWNEDEPAEVPVSCAKCHSGQGFLDYLGQDGSTALVVDQPAAVESIISCEVCHNEQTESLDRVLLPSGNEVALDANNALCAACHSGTNTGSAVVAAVNGYTDDEIVPDGSFINPYYAFAALAWLGSEGSGGYEYEQKEYVGIFEHATGVQTCTQCHDAHSLHMNTASDDSNLCSACHSNVTGYTDYRDVTVDEIDYDGDGTVEGLYHEIEGVRAVLLSGMQQYTLNELGEQIGWFNQYPYLFKDTDKNGEISQEEAVFSNSYPSFTPRLMRTSFNLQFSLKDPAGYVHNGKYILQLLFDSIEDLSSVVDIPFDLSLRPQS